MSRSKSKSPPKYRHHKARDLAVVTINRSDHYLGPYGSPDSYNEYAKLIAEWRQGLQGEAVSTTSPNESIRIAELTLSYWTHCQTYYHHEDGSNGRLAVVRSAMQAVNACFANEKASNFGPLKLQTARQTLIDRNLSRTYINDLVAVIIAMFRWAVAQEMVDVRVHQALSTVAGLRKGKSEARESPPVEQVALAVVEATLNHAPRIVGAMVQLQLLTGARPGEIRNMKPKGITIQTDGTWCYRPDHHKTEHHGKQRRIYIGPRAQEVLRPFLDRDPDAYCFSPREAEEARRSEMRAKRKTPIQPSQRNRLGKKNPCRRPGEKYCKNSYNRAIARACRKAGVPEWSPNQLRHTAATVIRERYGIESAQVVLGHSDPRTTEIYAERDFQKAASIMRELG
jgi:integrase